MSGWQRIDNAPMDGTTILVTDGRRFAAAHRAFRIEDDWKFLGYDEGCRYEDGSLKIGNRFSERVSNPNAGKRHEWWQLHGCSAFSFDTDTKNYDGSIYFEPTHWVPLPELPQP